ncbi:MAG: hypothetical protein J0I52_00450 [Bordetella sp.]|nr:hypothetical protein [Bordetella sp.]
MQSSLLLAAAGAIAVIAVSSAPVAKAQTPLEQGLSGALRGCEEWVLNPQSWTEGPAPFLAVVGLGDAMGQVARVDEASLPPPALRQGNIYWRINSTETAGYVLVVSDQTPMCHITGGGRVDLQPVVEAVLKSADFDRRWEAVQQSTQRDMTTTIFRNRIEPALSIIVSRAKSPGSRLDRVQVLVSGVYEMSR